MPPESQERLRIKRLEDRIPLSIRWARGRTLPRIEKEQLVIFEDLTQDDAKMGVRRGSKSYWFFSGVVAAGDSTDYSDMDLLAHAARHATGGSSDANIGQDPIGPYTFTWTHEHTWSPATTGRTPITVNAASGQTASLLVINDDNAATQVEVGADGLVGFGDPTRTAQVNIKPPATGGLFSLYGDGTSLAPDELGYDSDLEVWCVGDDISGSDGSNVTTWVNRGSGGNYIDDGDPPHLNVDQLNGHKTVETDGAEYLESTSGLSGSTSATVIAIYKTPNDGSGIAFCLGIDSVNQDGVRFPGDSPIANARIYDDNNEHIVSDNIDNEYYDGGPIAGRSQWHIGAFTRDNSGNWHYYHDGTDETYSGGSPPTVTGAIGLGQLFRLDNDGTNAAATVEVAEFIAFDSKELTEDECGYVYNYLANKYGLLGGPALIIRDSSDSVVVEVDALGQTHIGGGSPTHRLLVTDTSTQARFRYDTDNYFDITVDSSGNTVLEANGVRGIEVRADGEVWIGEDGVTAGKIVLMDSGIISLEPELSTGTVGHLELKAHANNARVDILGSALGLGRISFKDALDNEYGGIQTGDGVDTGDFYIDTDTLYVDASEERVGINTSTPGAALEVVSTTEPQVRIAYDADDYLDILVGDDNLAEFAFNDVKSLRLNSIGYVGVGTTPAELLHVFGGSPQLRLETSFPSGQYIDFNVNTDEYLVLNDSTSTFIEFGNEAGIGVINSPTDRLRIQATDITVAEFGADEADNAPRINLKGKDGGRGTARGGALNWHNDATSSAVGFMYCNAYDYLVFDSTIQAVATDTGNAWIDLSNGDASFNSLAVSGSLVLTEEDDNNSGYFLYLYHDSASPASLDRIGAIAFDGNDSVAFRTTYGLFSAFIRNPVNLSEAVDITVNMKPCSSMFSFYGTTYGDIGVGPDSKVAFDGTHTTVSLLGVVGDTYLVYDSAGSTLDCFVDGTEMWNADTSATRFLEGLVIPSGETPAPAEVGALFLDTNLGTNGTLMCYADSAWRTVADLAGFSETNDLETACTGIETGEIVYGASADTAAYAKISALTEETTPAAGDWLLAEESGGNIRKIDVGDLPAPTLTYMYPVWAEENAALANSTYEWAFGNGASTPSDGGITIYVPSGWTCTVVAMSLRLGSGTATVELVHNGTLQGANCNVTVSSGQGATNDSFTPISISDGDYINFFTNTASGTSSPNVVTAWLKMEET